MDFTKFTNKSQGVIQKAQVLAEEKGHQAIEPGHLLKSIFIEDKDVVPYLFSKLNINASLLEKTVDSIIESYSKVTGGQVYLSSQTQKTLASAIQEAKNFGDDFVTIELILFAMLDLSESIGKLLKDNKITKTNLKNLTLRIENSNQKR